MTKKHILIGTIAALLATANIADAPGRAGNYFNPIQNPIRIHRQGFWEDYKEQNEETINELIKKKKEIEEEQKLLEQDKIYRMIYSFYDSLNPPEYITKKFIRALIRLESEDYPRAKSRMGARGLGQLRREAWYAVEKEDYGRNVFIPEKNIRATIKYLLWIDTQLKNFHPEWNEFANERKVKLIASAYNGGIGRLQRTGWDIEKMPYETRHYVPKIERIAEKIIPSTEIYGPSP